MLSKKNYLSYLENLKIKLNDISRYFALNLNFICNEFNTATLTSEKNI